MSLAKIQVPDLAEKPRKRGPSSLFFSAAKIVRSDQNSANTDNRAQTSQSAPAKLFPDTSSSSVAAEFDKLASKELTKLYHEAQELNKKEAEVSLEYDRVTGDATLVANIKLVDELEAQLKQCREQLKVILSQMEVALKKEKKQDIAETARVSSSSAP